MKKQLFIIMFFLPVLHIFCQTDNIENVKMINNHLFVGVFSNSWINAPKGMQIQPNSLSSDIYWMLAPVGKKSVITASIGYGFSAHSIKSNGLLYADSLKKTYFNTGILDTVDYKINKFTTVYFDIPVEMRLRTRPNLKHKNLVFVLGFKAGVLIQSYTKYYGNEYRFAENNDEVKFKSYKTKNLMPYRFGIYSKIGYGKFYVFGYYSLSGLFAKNKGPNVSPVSLGISISLYRSKTY